MSTEEPPLDAARLVGEARERAARKRTEGAYGDDPAAVPLELDPVPEKLADAAVVAGRRDTLYGGPAPVTFARRGALKLLAPFLGDLLQQINAFQIRAARDVERLEGRVEALSAEVEELRAELRKGSSTPRGERERPESS